MEQKEMMRLMDDILLELHARQTDLEKITEADPAQLAIRDTTRDVILRFMMFRSYLPAEVVIEVHGGVADVDHKPEWIGVRIDDYDAGQMECPECGEDMFPGDVCDCGYDDSQNDGDEEPQFEVGQTIASASEVREIVGMRDGWAYTKNADGVAEKAIGPNDLRTYWTVVVKATAVGDIRDGLTLITVLLNANTEWLVERVYENPMAAGRHIMQIRRGNLVNHLDIEDALKSGVWFIKE